MSRQEINLGALPSGLGGDTPRSANMKINAMTAELYARDSSLGSAANLGTSNDQKPVPGQVLQPGDWGLTHNTIAPPANISLNDLVDPGFYFVTNDLKHTERPEGFTYGHLHVIRAGGLYVKQFIYNLFTDGIRQRWRDGAGTWSAWTKVHSEGDWGMGGTTEAPSTNDLNTMGKKGGLYSVNGHTNIPKEAYWAGTLLQANWGSDPRWVSQLHMGVSYNELHYRSVQNGVASGSGWARIFTNENVVGPVTSNIAANSTSAIIEVGGTGGHRFTRFAGGQMIYTIQYDAGYTALNTVTLGLQTTFVGYPGTSVSIVPSINWDWDIVAYASPTAVVFVSKNTFNQSVIMTMIGRWF